MKRSPIKWIHWFSFLALLDFFFVEPAENSTDRGAALATHAGVGIVLAIVSLVWIVDVLRGGSKDGPGPKLSQGGKRFRLITHQTMFWGMILSIGSGFFAGLVAPYDIRAIGMLLINTGTGSKAMHDVIGEAHGLIFNLLIMLTLVHIGFHLWRHLHLRDNALKIMMPRALHRFL